MSMMSSPEIWRIVNPGMEGAYGGVVGYEIEAMGAMTMLTPGDYMQRRAGFTNHTLWVTPFAQNDLFAAGDYPSVSTAGAGLPAWTAANRAVANTDVVAWLTMGFPTTYRVLKTGRSCQWRGTASRSGRWGSSVETRRSICRRCRSEALRGRGGMSEQSLQSGYGSFNRGRSRSGRRSGVVAWRTMTGGRAAA